MPEPITHPQESDNVFNFGTVRALALLVGLVALLGMIYLGQSSQATVTGQHVLELQDRLERTRRENAQIEYEIATLSTPDKIAERARRLGFRPATLAQTVYIVVKNYPSAPQPTSIAPEINSPPTPDFWEGVWLDVLTRLNLANDAHTVEASPR